MGKKGETRASLKSRRYAGMSGDFLGKKNPLLRADFYDWKGRSLAAARSLAFQSYSFG